MKTKVLSSTTHIAGVEIHITTHPSSASLLSELKEDSSYSEEQIARFEKMHLDQILGLTICGKKENGAPVIDVFFPREVPKDLSDSTIGHESVHVACGIIREKKYHDMSNSNPIVIGCSSVKMFTESDELICVPEEYLSDEEELAQLVGVAVFRIQSALALFDEVIKSGNAEIRDTYGEVEAT